MHETENHGEMSLKDWYRNIYLESEGWRETRKNILDEFNNRCVVCDTNQKMNVHHFTYNNLGNETHQDALPLCRECHERYHKIFDPIIKMKRDAFLEAYIEIEEYIEKIRRDAIELKSGAYAKIHDAFVDGLAEFLANSKSKYSNIIINNLNRAMRDKLIFKVRFTPFPEVGQKEVSEKRKIYKRNRRGE
jgi:hypothetical protein